MAENETKIVCCGDCEFFDEHDNDQAKRRAKAQGTAPQDACHFNPAQSVGRVQAAMPVVTASDWCSHFVPSGTFKWHDGYGRTIPDDAKPKVEGRDTKRVIGPV
jgi:hypothetical protein